MKTSSLDGQIAVVTGASRGIGAAIATKLGSMGAHVILTARNRTAMQSIAQKIVSTGGSAETRSCDLTDAAQLESLARSSIEKHGRCDILVNNAGIGSFDKPLHATSPEDFDQIIATNLRAPYLLLRAFAPFMIDARRGHIVNISSLAGRNPVANAAAYAASKWGLNGMMISAAEELRQYQVRVSLVEPGSVQTEFAAGMASAKSSLGAIHVDDIADIVALLVTQKDQCFISEVSVRPTLKK